MDNDSLSSLVSSATINVASVTTDDRERDDNLRSVEFFDAESFPEMTFSRSRLEDVDGDSFTLSGDLTMHGVTKRVTLQGRRARSSGSASGSSRVAFTASCVVSRRDFGLTWKAALEAGGLLVGDEVKVSIEIEAEAEAVDAGGASEAGSK